MFAEDLLRVSTLTGQVDGGVRIQEPAVMISYIVGFSAHSQSKTGNKL